MSEDTSASSNRSVLGTLGVIVVALVALSIFDAFLARTERAENRAEADWMAAAGRDSIANGRSVEAVAQFKSALAIEREDPQFWLALGQAQLAAGEVNDAETTLRELLRRDSTSGAANLTLARVLVKQGRITEAVSTYHQSIYGRWNRDAEKDRIAVRFELVNLLAQQGSKEELLAELLPLIDVDPDNVAERKKLGHLFLIAGSGTRAGEMFRDVLRHHPQDAEAYAGLGESEFMRANYQTALTDFQIALYRHPADRDLTARLALSSEVLALDPMRRGIGPEEQFRRSLKILEMAEEVVARCNGEAAPADSAKKEHPPKLNEAMEKNLSTAEQLWKTRKQDCKLSPEEEPLRLVLAKIAQ